MLRDYDFFTTSRPTVRTTAQVALILFVLVFLFATVAVPRLAAAYDPKAEARDSNETPPELQGIGITEQLGQKLDLDLHFRDETGAQKPLREFFRGGQPVVLSLVYYGCTSLCNLHLNGVTSVLKEMKWTAGNQFQLVTVSIDPREKPDLAAEKKAAYIEEYGRPEAASGWHFLTGDEPEIERLAKSVGFRYRWDEEGAQWAHASAAIIVTPDGRISRYLHGVHFLPQTFRLSLVEASDGKVGSIVDNIILFCFHYDPRENKYALVAFNVMRAGAATTVAAMMAFFIPFWVRQRRSLGRPQGVS